MNKNADKRNRFNLPEAADLWSAVLQNKSAFAGFLILILFILTAIFADQIATFDPLKTSDLTLLPPSRRFLFGTDDLGRDVFSGVIFGARSSLSLGLIVTLISALIGILVGASAGYAGGAWDDFLMRVTELFLVPPRFFLALIIVALFGSTFFYLVLILSFTYWTTMARLVRAEVLSLKTRDFVEASRALGASDTRILLHEILPNALPLIITKMMLMVGQVIILQAGLEFIGIGDAANINWGVMLHNGQHFIRDAWWIIFFPTTALVLLVLSLNIVGDALNTFLNPQARSAFLNKSI